MEIFNGFLDVLERAWGVLIAMMWGLWEWRRRKGKAAKDKVDTINHLLKSVEDLSRKYDELLAANTNLREQLVELKAEVSAKEETIERLRARIEELENERK